MGRSFFHAKSYDALHAGSNTFSDLISAGAASYGLTPLQASEYAALNATFSAAFLLAQAPATRTTVTVQARNDAAIPLVAMASNLAKIIDGSGVTNDQKLALGLNVRKTPEPMPPPGQCSNFKVELQADGSIEATWVANNPPGMSGVTYQIYRRFGSVGEFAFFTASGEKKFVDDEIPAGTPQVQYQVRGIRPTGAGAWAQFNVNLGQPAAGTGGAMTAAVVETAVETKRAA